MSFVKLFNSNPIPDRNQKREVPNLSDYQDRNWVKCVTCEKSDCNAFDHKNYYKVLVVTFGRPTETMISLTGTHMASQICIEFHTTEELMKIFRSVSFNHIRKKQFIWKGYSNGFVIISKMGFVINDKMILKIFEKWTKSVNVNPNSLYPKDFIPSSKNKAFKYTERILFYNLMKAELLTRIYNLF